ncbi:hypothetical protein WJX72_000074 [[Myrmecia] bisecta]|uniref:Uncharacterized protein n=1 Tax=[Myrmecia] bisecta TaxID=41462 RepID=A0AAW1PAH3_9CHLO
MSLYERALQLATQYEAAVAVVESLQRDVSGTRAENIIGAVSRNSQPDSNIYAASLEYHKVQAREQVNPLFLLSTSCCIKTAAG